MEKEKLIEKLVNKSKLTKKDIKQFSKKINSLATKRFIESIILMKDKKFMNSYNKSKEQIKKRDFEDWNKL